MSNEEKNDIKDNLKNKNEAINNVIKEKSIEESDKDESKDSVNSDELDKELEDERQKFLNNPQSFKRKRDFFSFYSKHRASAMIPQKTPSFNRNFTRNNSHIIVEKPEYKRFTKYELKPRGFGISKVKEKIEFFEKKNLESQYKTLNLTPYQKTFYENNEPRQFNSNLFKIQKRENLLVSFDNTINNFNQNKKIYRVSQEFFSFSLDNKNEKQIKKNSENKLNLNLAVDYSKILNSSKITKKEKELDLFLTNKDDKNRKSKDKNKEKKNFDYSSDSSSSSDSSILSKEVSTNLGSLNTISNHNRIKSEICSYKDLLNKISEPINNNSIQHKFKDDYNTYQLKESNKNNKYIIVKKNNNKISLQKDNKYKLRNGIKKVFSETISDNITLKKLDNAKNKLKQANNYKNMKRQIEDILDSLIFEKTYKNKLNSDEKINNIYDREKLIRAFEIIPQLSLINHKISTILENKSNSTESFDKNNLNEKTIKQLVSSIYFLECIGLEPIILFNGKNKMENKKFINDLDENMELSGYNNKKKFIKYYIKNLNKANLFLGILIKTIKNLQDSIKCV